MSEKHDDYRRQAEYCERMARRADSQEYKASWLKLASKWLILADAPRQTNEAESFQALVDRKGTGQEDSSSKH